jgi:hypothetical protein
MINPFTVNVAKTDTECQDELLELKSDEENILTFNNDGYLKMWQTIFKKMPKLYPNM